LNEAGACQAARREQSCFRLPALRSVAPGAYPRPQLAPL